MSEQTFFVGCSFTAGSGFEKEKCEPNIWPMLLHTNIPQLSVTEYVNLGIIGAGNDLIFITATNAILDYRPKYIFVQWSSYPRLNLLLGLETYNATQTFGWDCKLNDHKLNNVNYSAEYLSKVRDRFLSLEHPHNQIKNIVNYTNILIKIANQFNCKIFFVNGLCAWDQNYFNRLDNVSPNQFTPYTQNLLNIETRNDQEIFELYNNIHNKYQELGGIQEDHWLNLYNSLLSNRIDTNSDNVHPGTKSNHLFFKFLSQSLLEKLSS